MIYSMSQVMGALFSDKPCDDCSLLSDLAEMTMKCQRTEAALEEAIVAYLDMAHMASREAALAGDDVVGYYAPRSWRKVAEFRAIQRGEVEG